MVKEEIASFDNLWAGFIGLVIGFVVAKVYQIWSILFIEYGRSLMHDPITGWRSKPFWVLATEYPSMFVFIVSLTFMTFAIIFLRFLKRRSALLKYSTDQASTQSEVQAQISDYEVGQGKQSSNIKEE